MIDTFVVMAILQTARARELGYSLSASESFGLSRAYFYKDISKSGLKQPRSVLKHRISTQSKNSRKKHLTEIEVGNEKVEAVLDNDQILFIHAKKIITPLEYEEKIKKTFGPNYDLIWNQAKSIVGDFDRQILENQQTFYVFIYKVYKDILIENWAGLQMSEKIEQICAPTYHSIESSQSRYMYSYAHQITRPKKKK